jgi:hypothetical protein
MANKDIEHLLILARRYSAEKALSLNTVSLYAAGQGRLMERLQAGCGITVGRRDRILQWFSDHWPVGLPWPEEIARPWPSSRGEAGESAENKRTSVGTVDIGPGRVRREIQDKTQSAYSTACLRSRSGPATG